MNSDVALCEHLRSSALRELPIDPADVLDWADGPVNAVTRCPACAALGLLELVDWSRSRRVRIFALSGLPEQSLALYRRNQERGSCDAARAERETEALYASAGPVERLVALDVEGGGVLRSAPHAPTLRLPDGAWQARLPDKGDPSWFSLLGLDK